MTDLRLTTTHLELRPMAADAASALPGDRVSAAARIGATLAPGWPMADLLDVLPIQATATPDTEPFGIWVLIEAGTRVVVGDIGFMGPPDVAGVVEVGFSVVPDRRRRGYASEALAALVTWVIERPSVASVIARCDVDNEASVRTLRQAGFIETGAADGMLVWRFAGASLPG
jgi:ribosomal-protein-alanine N-acetyltransferase